MSELYPNGGTSQYLDDDEVAERERATKVQVSAPVIPDLLKYLESRIDYYRSPESIDANINDDPALHQRKVLASQMLVMMLENEKEKLKENFKQYM